MVEGLLEAVLMSKAIVPPPKPIPLVPVATPEEGEVEKLPIVKPPSLCFVKTSIFASVPNTMSLETISVTDSHMVLPFCR